MAAGDKTVIASESYVDSKVQTDVPAGAVFTDTVYDDSTTTKQGNTFNGNTQLVQTTTEGKLPAIDGSLLTGIDGLPDQTDNAGKYLITDGTLTSWGEVDLSSKADVDTTYTKAEVDSAIAEIEAPTAGIDPIAAAIIFGG